MKQNNCHYMVSIYNYCALEDGVLTEEEDDIIDDIVTIEIPERFMQVFYFDKEGCTDEELFKLDLEYNLFVREEVACMYNKTADFIDRYSDIECLE